MRERPKLNLLLWGMTALGVVSTMYTWFLLSKNVGPFNLTLMITGGLTTISLIVLALVQLSLNKRLRVAAMHDTLTGLLNRTAFDRLYKSLFDYAKLNEITFHLILIDLNKFKQINDSMGHDVGDEVLRDVAAKLQTCIGADHTLARLGGDEFGILIPDPLKVNSYSEVIDKIVATINVPSRINNHTMFVNCSIGIATYPDTADSPVSLMRCADVAMYASKKTQKNYSVYTVTDDNASATDLLLMGELRHALDDGNCELWYQPKKNLSTGKVDAAECLMRWRHPIRGIINPGTFIPAAESSGLIKLITQFVIREATAGFKELTKLGNHMSLSINVSPIDIVDPTIMTSIIKSIVQADMPPNRLILEVTETAIMSDPNAVFKVLIALESLGIKLSIDDFGTGHSSLLYLKNFPIHEVKLDRSFIIDIATNKESYNIVRSTIDLSHTLGAITVAEGVETQDIEDLLKELGCDYVQGYFVAKAMPLDEFAPWLANHNKEIVNAE
jgi:diguanylate cyclase (GGDEF)-like protein